jgi:DNA-binding transcriptional ArsR family regulator
MEERAATDLLGYSQLNAQLHAAILVIAAHATATKVLSTLQSQAVRYQFRTILQPGRPAQSLAEHRAIVECICKGDEDGAEAAMRRHLGAGLTQEKADAYISKRRRKRAARLEAVFKALAEPRRVAILKLLAGGEMRAGAIAERFETTRPAISEHLRVLTDANLVVSRREGTRRIYAVRKETFKELQGYLSQFWDDRLTRLKAAAEREAHRPPRRTRR